MPDARFPVQLAGGVPVVAAPEQVDITNASGLRAALLEAAARGHGRVVVDMTQTLFCDTAGLHALAGAHKRAEAEGGEVLLVIPGAAVLRLFAITGLDHVIPNFTSLEDVLVQMPAAATPAPPPSSPWTGPGEPGQSGTASRTPGEIRTHLAAGWLCSASSFTIAISARPLVARSPNSQFLPRSPSTEAIVKPFS